MADDEDFVDAMDYPADPAQPPAPAVVTTGPPAPHPARPLGHTAEPTPHPLPVPLPEPSPAPPTPSTQHTQEAPGSGAEQVASSTYNTLLWDYTGKVTATLQGALGGLGGMLWGPGQPMERQQDAVEMAALVNEWRTLNPSELQDSRHAKLVIAVMGRVSSGKSTLMKALLQIPPERTDVLQVSALSGTTREAQAILWRVGLNDFLLLDFPGFQEVYNEHTQDQQRFDDIMKTFLRYGGIDVGICVVNGVPDRSQKDDYDRLARYARKVFLVRTKADDLERYNETRRREVVAQWTDQFHIDHLYQTKILGYDPAEVEYFPNALVEGVDELRSDICAHLEGERKAWGLQLVRNGVLNVFADKTGSLLTASAAILIALIKAYK